MKIDESHKNRGKSRISWCENIVGKPLETNTLMCTPFSTPRGHFILTKNNVLGFWGYVPRSILALILYSSIVPTGLEKLRINGTLWKDWGISENSNGNHNRIPDTRGKLMDRKRAHTEYQNICGKISNADINTREFIHDKLLLEAANKKSKKITRMTTPNIGKRTKCLV